MLFDLPPQLPEACVFKTADHDDGWAPRGRTGVHQPERARVLTFGVAPVLEIVAVALVDGDHVRQLHDAALDALEFVAGIGQHQHQKEVYHAGDYRFALTHTHRLHQHHVKAGRLTHHHCLARLAPDTSEFARGGRRPYERTRIP